MNKDSKKYRITIEVEKDGQVIDIHTKDVSVEEGLPPTVNQIMTLPNNLMGRIIKVKPLFYGRMILTSNKYEGSDSFSKLWDIASKDFLNKTKKGCLTATVICSSESIRSSHPIRIVGNDSEKIDSADANAREFRRQLEDSVKNTDKIKLLTGGRGTH